MKKHRPITLIYIVVIIGLFLIGAYEAGVWFDGWLAP